MNESSRQLPTTNSSLLSILDELKSREPIFHHPEFGVTQEALEQQTATDYWEVGASGVSYSRELVIETVVRRFEEDTEVDTANWQISEFYCRELGTDTYLITYLLEQDGRLSRRATIWRHSDTGWQILYHQGTLVSSTTSSSTANN